MVTRGSRASCRAVSAIGSTVSVKGRVGQGGLIPSLVFGIGTHRRLRKRPHRTADGDPRGCLVDKKQFGDWVSLPLAMGLAHGDNSNTVPVRDVVDSGVDDRGPRVVRPRVALRVSTTSGACWTIQAQS